MVTAGFHLIEAIIILRLMVSTEFKDLYPFRFSSIPTPLILVLFRAFSVEFVSSTQFFISWCLISMPLRNIWCSWVQTISMPCFSAEAIIYSMFFYDERFLQSNVEIRDAFLHFSSLLLFSLFLSVAFFLTSACHPTAGHTACWSTQQGCGMNY